MKPMIDRFRHRRLLLGVGIAILCLAGVAFWHFLWQSRRNTPQAPRSLIMGLGWNSRGIISFLTASAYAEHPDQLIMAEGKVTSLGAVLGSFGWSPNGRYFLISRQNPESPLFSSPLAIYDSFLHTTRFITDATEDTSSACWVDDSTVCFVEREGDPKISIAYSLVLKSIAKKDTRKYPVPQNLLVERMACNTQTHTVLFTATYVTPGRFQQWLYMFRDGHMTPIPGTARCSAEFAVNPAAPNAAIVLQTAGAATGIGFIDLSQPMPHVSRVINTASNPDLFWITHPLFSPDGNGLGFRGQAYLGQSSLYLCNSATEHLQPGADGEMLAFSPNGTQIAYAKEGDTALLYTCELNGDDPQKIFSLTE